MRAGTDDRAVQCDQKTRIGKQLKECGYGSKNGESAHADADVTDEMRVQTAKQCVHFDKFWKVKICMRSTGLAMPERNSSKRKRRAGSVSVNRPMMPSPYMWTFSRVTATLIDLPTSRWCRSSAMA